MKRRDDGFYYEFIANFQSGAGGTTRREVAIRAYWLGMPMLFALIGDRNEPPIVTAVASVVIGAGVAAVILWERRYRRVWEQSRAQQWPQSEGRFFSGEVVTLRKGRSGRVAGFEVQMLYQYQAGRTMTGIYKRMFSTKEAAEALVKSLERQKVSVRIANGKPSLSCVLDRDVDTLVPPTAVEAHEL